MSSKNFETEAIRTQIERSKFLEHSNPLYLTSSFVFEDSEDMRASFADEKERNIYSRFSNPNTSEFVEKICKMEGAESGYAFATGMSALASDVGWKASWPARLAKLQASDSWIASCSDTNAFRCAVVSVPDLAAFRYG